jgi:hypothetical protein
MGMHDSNLGNIVELVLTFDVGEMDFNYSKKSGRGKMGRGAGGAPLLH